MNFKVYRIRYLHSEYELCNRLNELKINLTYFTSVTRKRHLLKGTDLNTLGNVASKFRLVNFVGRIKVCRVGKASWIRFRMQPFIRGRWIERRVFGSLFCTWSWVLFVSFWRIGQCQKRRRGSSILLAYESAPFHFSPNFPPSSSSAGPRNMAPHDESARPPGRFHGQCEKKKYI